MMYLVMFDYNDNDIQNTPVMVFFYEEHADEFINSQKKPHDYYVVEVKLGDND